MSLVFAAIVPHPPILIPTVGKENLERIKATVEAMKKLEQELYAAKPDILIIISPHGPILSDAFAINASPTYEGKMEQFGDFSTHLEFTSALGFINQLRENFETKEPPIILISETALDHGALVPLYYLTQHLPEIQLVPIGYSLLDLNAQLTFGENLKEEIVKTNQRVAVLASGDLSHRLTKDAPAGFSEQGKKFDQQLIKHLLKKDVAGILKFNPSLIEEAGECGLRSIMVLLGVLKDTNYQPQKFSYEGPFGVGYLVMNFAL